MWYNLETFGMKLAERPYGNIIAERQIALLHCAVTSSPHRGSVRKTSSQEWVCTLWGRRLQLICSLRRRSCRACIPEKLLVAELVQGCVGSRGNAYSLGFVPTRQWSMHFTRFHVVK